MLPVMKSNIAVLLQDGAFKELLLELPDLNFCLLAMLDTSSAASSEPSAKRVKFEVSDKDDEDSEDEEGHTPPRGTLRYRFGRGSTLG